jgi:hypothetical protein
VLFVLFSVVFGFGWCRCHLFLFVGVADCLEICLTWVLCASSLCLKFVGVLVGMYDIVVCED